MQYADGIGPIQKNDGTKYTLGHKGCSTKKSDDRIFFNQKQANHADSNFDKVRPVLAGNYSFIRCDACDSVTDEKGHVYWYPKTQTRTVQMCGVNKTVYDSAEGCFTANDNEPCAAKRGGFITDTESHCALDGNYYPSENVCERVNGIECVTWTIFGGQMFWYPDDQTRTVVICGMNKTSYDSKTDARRRTVG